MTNEQILQVIKDWITGDADAVPVKPSHVPAGCTVIEANQNAPRPEKPYITILITSTLKEAWANISSPNSDGDASIETEASVMVSLQCFGDDSKSIMDGLCMSLEKVTVRQALRAAGLPFIRVSNGVTDLTESVATKFETRVGMDLEFRAVLAITDNIGVIESVQVTGTNETGASSTITTDNTIGV